MLQLPQKVGDPWGFWGSVPAQGWGQCWHSLECVRMGLSFFCLRLGCCIQLVVGAENAGFFPPFLCVCSPEGVLSWLLLHLCLIPAALTQV